MPRIGLLRPWRLRRRKQRRESFLHGKGHDPRVCYRPLVEPLEQRLLLATSLEPRGSLIYESRDSGEISAADEVDDYMIDVDPGQTLTVVAETDSSLDLSLTLKGPTGTTAASANNAPAGADEVIQTFGPTAAGTYTIEVAGASQTTGDYTLQLVLNAAVEMEAHNGVSNDDAANAQDLDDGFIELVPGGAERAAVVRTSEVDTSSLTDGFETGDFSALPWTTSGDEVWFVTNADSGSGTFSAESGGITHYEESRLEFQQETGEGNIEFDRYVSSESCCDHLRFYIDGSQVGSWAGTQSWSTVSFPVTAGLHTFAWEYTKDGSVDTGLDLARIDDVTFPQPSPPGEDWYSFTLDDGQSATAILTSLNDGDATLELYDAAEERLAVGRAASIDGLAINNFVDTTTNGAADTYWVRITGRDSTDYSLLVGRDADFDTEPNGQVAPAAQDLSPIHAAFGGLSAGGAPITTETEPNDDGVSGGSAADLPFANDWSGSFVSIGGNDYQAQLTATISAGYDADWDFFKIYASPGDTLVVDSTGQTLGDTYLHLYDRTGGWLDSDDDSGPGVDARITYSAFPYAGEYYVVGDSYGSGTGTYLLTAKLTTTDPSGTADTDVYSVEAVAGDVLTIETFTPAAGPFEFVNDLDPYLELYDPNGDLAASDDNGAGDTRNALISHEAALTGAYSVAISYAGDEGGEYAVTVTGQTGDAPEFAVAAMTPSDGETFAVAPTQLVVDFNDSVRLTSVEVDSITVDALPMADMTIVDHDTVLFDLPVAAGSDGPHTVSIAAGAFVDLQGTPIEAFTSSYLVDTVAPRIIGVSIQQDDVRPVGNIVFTAQFDEELIAANLTVSDVSLVGVVSGLVFPGSVQYEPASSTLTLQYNNLADDQYTLTLLSGDGQFEDLVGNDLDGEPVEFPFPPNRSGDGVEGGDFFVDFTADLVEAPYPVPLEAKDPPGSLIYDPFVEGVVGTATDEDRYTIAIDDDQTITVVLSPDANLRPAVELFDPGSNSIGSATAAAAGEDVILQAAATTGPGTYTVSITGAGGSTGTYASQVTLNAAVEFELPDGATNDVHTAAEDIGGSFIDVAGDVVRRGAVLGRLRDAEVLVIGEDWESGTVGAAWTLDTSAPVGRIENSTSRGGAQGSSRALLMDVSSSGTYNRNEAVWTVDLSGLDRANLSFYHAEWSDETDPFPGDFVGSVDADGVAISDDGVHWHPVLDAPDQVSGQWVPYTIDLVAEAAAADMTLGPNFRIKFQQYDNYSITTDGRGYDQIRITTPDPGEDWFSFPLAAGDTVTLAATGSAAGLELGLHDAAGTLVALAAPGGPHVDRTIDRLVVPATGTYKARVSGAGLSYSLVIVTGATFDMGDNMGPEPFNGDPAQSITGVGGVLGQVDPAAPYDAGDWYQLNLNQNDQLVLQTSTPADGTREFVNDLDPQIEVYDGNGTLVVSDDNSRDGRNARLTWQAPATGSYWVNVESSAASPNSQGEYLLQVQGVTGDLDRLTVTGTDVPDGIRLAAQPTTIEVDFSGTVFWPSVQPADLLIDNTIPATDITAVDYNTIRFTLPIGLGEGVHTIDLPAGVVDNLQRTGVDPFHAEFVLDFTGPRIVGASVQQADSLVPGPASFVFDLSEPMNAADMNVADVELLRDSLVTHTASLATYDAGGTTLTVDYDDLPEGAYTLTLWSGDGQFEDVAGNDLDGEPVAFPIPPNQSGDGVLGGDFAVDFVVDRTTVTAAPFTRLDPLGSLMATSENTGLINAGSDIDEFTFFMTDGESVAVTVRPDNPAARMTVELVSLSGTHSSRVAGAPARVPVQSIPADGIYTVRVSGDTTTTFHLVIDRNYVEEISDTATDDAMSIDPLHVSLGAGGRYGVMGTSTPTFVTSTTQRLFAVADDGQNEIVELDAGTGAEMNRFAAPEPVVGFAGSVGLAWGGSSLFFLNGAGTDTLYELDPDTGTELDSDVVTAGSGDYTGLATVGDVVFVLDETLSDIHQFDPATDTVTGTLNVDGINGVSIGGSLTAITGPDALLSLSGGDVVQIHPLGGQIVGSFPLSGGSEAGLAAVDGEIYAGSATDLRVYTRQGVFVRQATWPDAVIAIGGDSGEIEQEVLFGVQRDTQQIVRIDPNSGVSLDKFVPPEFLAPTVVALSGAEQGNVLLYQSLRVGGATTLYRLDPATGQTLSEEPLPLGGSSFRGGFSFQTGEPDVVFALDGQFPLERQEGYGGPVADHLTNVTPAVSYALGGDDQGRHFLAADNAGQLEIVEFDPLVPDTVINRFDAPAAMGTPAGLAFDGVYLYVSDTAGELFTLDPNTGTVLWQVTVPHGELTGLGVARIEVPPPYINRLFAVPADGSDDIVELDPYTLQEVNRFDAPESTGSGGNGLAFDGDSLFFLNGAGSDRIWQLDAAGQVIDSDLLTAGSGQYDALATLDGLVYVLDTADGDIHVFDPVTDTVVNTLDVDGTIPDVQLIGGLAALTGPDALVVVNGEPATIDQVLLLDPATAESVSSFDAVFSSPGATGLAAIGGDVYVANGTQIDVYTRDGRRVREMTITDPNTALGGDDVRGEPPAEITELIVNGGFETGDFTGWVAIDNGVPQVEPWAVTVAGGGHFGTTDPWSGDFSAHNGFDGAAGLEYELYQDVTIPGDSWATLTTNHRIIYDISRRERLFEITVRDTAHSVLETLFTQSVSGPLTDLGWNTQTFDLSHYAGQTVRIHFREVIPEPYTGPGQFEYDEISLVVQPVGVVLPEVDAYSIDLSHAVDRPIDVAVAAYGRADFSTARLELLAPDGATVLETAAPNPLGTPGSNYDLGIFGFTVPEPGVYTLRLTSYVEGRYGLIVTDSFAFDSEPNDELDDPLRGLNDKAGALGHVTSGDNLLPLGTVAEASAHSSAGAATPGNPAVGTNDGHDEHHDANGLFYAPPARRLVGSVDGQPASSSFALKSLAELLAPDPLDVAVEFVNEHVEELGLTPADVTSYIVTDQYASSHTGVTHVYLRQQYNGLEVVNADMNVNVSAGGQVISMGSSFVPDLGPGAGTEFVQPTLTSVEALGALADYFGWTIKVPPQLITTAAGPGQSHTIKATDLSHSEIPAQLHYVPTPDGGVQLAWRLTVDMIGGQHWYDASVSAIDGELLYWTDWVSHATYNVLPQPVESPVHGVRTRETDPHDPVASRYGWHDTDGVPGADHTDTRGNNVYAHIDWNNNNTYTDPEFADGGPALTFDFPIDFALHPNDYRDAAITNLFYWNNVLHDIHYHYGFDEPSGNFQQVNYTGQGAGGDAVQADAQDGSGTNNANFATPPDGSSGRMQQYIFTYTSPARDSDLDNGIIVHEYGHGVTNRLTGGPSNSGALSAQQSRGLGEGWSDFYALMLTQVVTDTPTMAYPMGTYALGHDPVTGAGIRRQPYSFDMNIDGITFGAYNSSQQYHNAGEIWASTLWDLNWLLIEGSNLDPSLPAGLGFDPDLYNGTGGNNMLLQLVMDGLKLQPARPSFLDARDAILQADQVLNGGAYQRTIWTAFARRGMGLSADDGGSSSSFSVTEAFDLPLFSEGSVEFDRQYYGVGDAVTVKLSDGDLAGDGTIVVNVVSDGGDLESVTLVELGGGVFQGTLDTVAAAPAAGNGTLDVASGDEFMVIYNDEDDGSGSGAVVTDTAMMVTLIDVFPADFSDAAGNPYDEEFATAGATSEWHLSTGRGNQPGHSADDSFYFGSGEDLGGNGLYSNNASGTLTSPVIDLTPFLGAELVFHHFLGVQGNFDQATVSILDANGSHVIARNGQELPNATNGFETVRLDVSEFAGQPIQVQFGFESDDTVTAEGWYVDDVIVRGGVADPTLVGPWVASADPGIGRHLNVTVSQIVVRYSEQVTTVSGSDPANYLLLEAGDNGVFENGGGDDLTIPITPSLDAGQTEVTLAIDPAYVPLLSGNYQLLIDGDVADGDGAVEDLTGNPLNSLSGPGGGANERHEFEILFQVEAGGDLYEIDLSAGETVEFTTQTPLADPNQLDPPNNLNPKLVVYSQTAMVLAVDQDSLDGKNARLLFTAPEGGTYVVQAIGEQGGGEYLLSTTPTSFFVERLVPTASGFVAHFSRPLDPAVLNLYDVQTGTFGAADVTLVGDTLGRVRGSLVVGTDSVTFVATGGRLPADTYTATLRSAADGFADLETGAPLDGDADGTPGNDHVALFSVAPEPVVIGLPDFTRGPGQDVRVPANGLGLPLTLNDARVAGEGIESVNVTITYDPELLRITSAAPGPDAPVGADLIADTTVPGRVVLSFTSATTVLPAGESHFITLIADVPVAAGYGDTHLLDLAVVSVTDDGGQPVAATADDAIHTAAFFGDATGNRVYSGLDAQRVARVVVGLDTGLVEGPDFPFRSVDPVVIVDVTGNDELSGLDAQRIAQEVVGLDPWQIPPLPQTLRLETVRFNQPGGIRPVDDTLAPRELDDEALTPVIATARARIESVEREAAGKLDDVNFEIVDLPGDVLGLTYGRTVYLDVNAAGYGWFLEKYEGQSTTGKAGFSDDEANLVVRHSTFGIRHSVDLLSVVLHELGHVLGRAHRDDGVMQDTLPLDTRRVWDDALWLDNETDTDAGDVLDPADLTPAAIDDYFAATE